jgi:manganese/zinc/iron transport system substrate-binding protein
MTPCHECRWLPTRLMALLVALATLTGCVDSDDRHQHPASGQKPLRQYQGDAPLAIFCTTGQVADAVRHVAGAHADVVALMGPGVDPHLFRPKPSDVLRLRRADIVFYNGLHLEGRIADTLEQLGEHKPVVAITEGLVAADDPRLQKPTEFEGYYDPHVWHDVALWSECVQYAADKLAEFDPQRGDDYRANAKAYRTQLDELNAECRTQLDTIPQDRRLLITAHDAFGYFSAAYGLQTIGLKGISTEDEADFAHLDEVRRMLVERKIPAVFIESSTSPRLVNQLIEECRRAGHEVRIGKELYSDAMGPAGSGAEFYIGMIRANVSAIVAGLGGG